MDVEATIEDAEPPQVESTDGESQPATPPSRQKFKSERRRKRADSRRKWLGIPLVALGIGMIGSGAYLWLQDDAPDVPTDVRGTSIVSTDINE